jgi:hypothetical protein
MPSLCFAIMSTGFIGTTGLVIEDSLFITILLNDVLVTSITNRWWVDEDIYAISLLPIPSRESTLKLIFPFKIMMNIKHIYILRDFGAIIRGWKAIVAALNKYSIDSVNGQGKSLILRQKLNLSLLFHSVSHCIF